MNDDDLKTMAADALKVGPVRLPSVDPLVRGVYLLKREGVPVVSHNEGKGGRIELVHQLVETALRPEEVQARRREGLQMALAWHRREPMDAWKGLLDSIPCPFAKDDAAEYLRGIIQRSRLAGKK
jgi:hypothetical protein